MTRLINFYKGIHVEASSLCFIPYYIVGIIHLFLLGRSHQIFFTYKKASPDLGQGMPIILLFISHIPQHVFRE